MIICIDCKKEMKCIENGSMVRFREDGRHVYAGDIFQCPNCKRKVNLTNVRPFYDEREKVIKNDIDIWMDT